MSDRAPITQELLDAQTRFVELVQPFRSELHRYCSRMTGSVLDGEDLVQDTLAQACFRFPMLRGDVALRPWLFTIAHHRCVDFLRGKNAARMVELDETEAPATEDDMAYEDRDLASRAFSQLVLTLPARERAAVILKEVLNYTLPEIAAILEISVGAVKSALHRARTKLVAAKDVALTGGEPPSPAAARYVDAFNRRDWAALLALLEDDVDVEVVGHVHHRGRDSAANNYIQAYAGFAFPWRLAFGEVDGEPVLVCLFDDRGTWIARHAVRVEWRGARVVRIRDYAHVPYVLADARLVLREP